MEEFTTKFENLWDSFFPNPTPAQLYAANDLKHQVVNNSHEDLLNTDFTAAEEVLGQDFVDAILLCGLWMKNQRALIGMVTDENMPWKNFMKFAVTTSLPLNAAVIVELTRLLFSSQVSPDEVTRFAILDLQILSPLPIADEPSPCSKSFCDKPNMLVPYIPTSAEDQSLEGYEHDEEDANEAMTMDVEGDNWRNEDQAMNMMLEVPPVVSAADEAEIIDYFQQEGLIASTPEERAARVIRAMADGATNGWSPSEEAEEADADAIGVEDDGNEEEVVAVAYLTNNLPQSYEQQVAAALFMMPTCGVYVKGGCTLKAVLASSSQPGRFV